MEDILKRIKQLNPEAPYVWQLHLKAKEYEALEQYLIAHQAETTGVLTQEMARCILVYWAEWFKRCYNGNDQAGNCVVDCEAKQVWEASGLDIEKYVYTTDRGTSLWKYSIYVLGGLAVNHELKRKNSDKFLKALCRMYHGEDYTLENLDEASRAIAFRQSIMQKHSLYHYLYDILSDKKESRDDCNQKLIARVKTANEEVLRTKFALEWIVGNAPGGEYLTRQLKVWFKPEEIGGGLHQYLRYDRVNVWGIPNPESLKDLFFGIRWWNGPIVVEELDKSNPLITYSNTKDGFVSWGAEQGVLCTVVPSFAVTRLQIVAFDKEGREWIAQDEEVKNWMQLWCADAGRGSWSSRPYPQRPTAVVYTEGWTANLEPDECKSIKHKQFGVGDTWNWNYIASDITLTHPNGASVTLYNREGYDQVYTQFYKQTIHYHEGGKVKYLTEDEEEGEMVEMYPLIFGPEDIRVRHFETKDAIVDARVSEDKTCERVEFKQNGRYVEWTQDERPAYGLVTLRATEKGTSYILNVLYLKGPIVRDLAHSAITYYNIEGEAETYQDRVTLNKQPLSPSIPLKIGDAEVDVFRPIALREIYLDERVHTYCPSGEEFILPEAFKRRVRIADFSEEGYHLYDCKQLPSLFASFREGIDNQPLQLMKSYASWPATDFDSSAPKWLRRAFTKEPKEEGESLALLQWNIYSADQPQPFVLTEGFKVKKGDLVFTNNECPDENLSYICPRMGKPDPFSEEAHSELDCFEVANRYSVYYSAFHILRAMADRKETREKLIEPLLAVRHGKLTSEDVMHLQGFIEEFQLDDNLLNIE